jgi:hypothetical protein
MYIHAQREVNRPFGDTKKCLEKFFWANLFLQTETFSWMSGIISIAQKFLNRTFHDEDITPLDAPADPPTVMQCLMTRAQMR